jgi:hypothetical protein
MQMCRWLMPVLPYLLLLLVGMAVLLLLLGAA